MIGFFDSGLGGLSVLVPVRRLLPTADLVYLADRTNAPYGDRTLAEVRGLSEAATRLLLERGCRQIVIPCNTASAAALGWLRSRHPGVPIVGMEPAVKPATAVSRSGIIGVLATTATFQGELFSSVVDRFATDCTVLPQACPGLADAVERGAITDRATESLVRRYVEPLLEKGADTLVLACTHYPFLSQVIRKVVGPRVAIVDPSASVARQVERVARTGGWSEGSAGLTFLVRGDTVGVAALVAGLTGLAVDPVGLP